MRTCYVRTSGMMLTTMLLQSQTDTPRLVHSPISWLGIAESLNIVANLQFGWKDYLSAFDWFAPYTESKSPSTPNKTRMSLRKRKQPPQPSSSPPQHVPHVSQEQTHESTVTSVTPATSDLAHDDHIDLDDDDDTCVRLPAKKKPRICCTVTDQQALAMLEFVDLEIPVPSATCPPSSQQPKDPVFNPVRTSERQKARKAAAAAAALKAEEATTAVSGATQPPSEQASRTSSCAPSDSSTIVIDACWPHGFLPIKSTGDPKSPSDLSAITMVVADMSMGPIEVVEIRHGKQEIEAQGAKKKGKAGAMDTPAPAAPSRASARRDAASGKKAQAVVASVKKQVKKVALKSAEKNKNAGAAKTKTSTPTAAPPRPKKKTRRR